MHKTLARNQTTVKELLFDCGTNLTPKHEARQPGRQGVDPDQGRPFNLLRGQKRPGTKHPFGHQGPWRVCKVGRVSIMRPAGFSVASARDLSFMLANIERYGAVFFLFFLLRCLNQPCQCVTLADI